MDESGRNRDAWRVRAIAHLKARWLIGLVVVVLGGYAGLFGLAWSVQVHAHQFAERARHDFSGDQVDALIGLVQSDSRTLAERNRAVNALGQIGSRRALPVLARYYDGRKCEHSQFLCQKELRKAMDRCSGRNWAPSWWPFFPRPPIQVGA